jgi:hypothetical protein
MTSPQPELPSDIASCHTLIKQLHAELQIASERIEELASLGRHDTAETDADFRAEIPAFVAKIKEIFERWQLVLCHA